MSETLNSEQKISRVETIVENHPEVAGLQAFEYFRSKAWDQKEAFISGELTELDLKYPALNQDAIVAIRNPMLDALKPLMSGEKSEKSEALYDAVEYRYSELFMMDMSRIMNSTAASNEDRIEAEKWFVIANESLYGKPNKDVFSALAKRKISERIHQRTNDDESTTQLRNELNKLIGPIDETEYEPFVPSVELVHRISLLVRERFSDLVSHIDSTKRYTIDEMVKVLDISLEKIGAKELGWKAELVPDSSALAVSAHKKIVEVGENRQSTMARKLKILNIHEIAVHVGRSINAEKAGWTSARYGQDSYLKFEEALAVALQDAYRGRPREHGVDYQLIAGLAYGLDNHTPRDFNEAYEIMWRIKALEKIDSVKTDPNIGESAKSIAFKRCLRLFRGTTGKQKGVVSLKDLAYFDGQESVWSILKDIKSQDELDYLFAGKLDNSKEEHQRIAEQIIMTNRSI